MNCETVSVQEAARLLGVGRSLAYRLAASGRIPALRLGRRLVVPKPALERFLRDGPERRREGGETT